MKISSSLTTFLFHMPSSSPKSFIVRTYYFTSLSSWIYYPTKLRPINLVVTIYE